MFGIKIVSKDQRRIERLEIENSELLEQVSEQSNALIELAEIIEEVVNNG